MSEKNIETVYPLAPMQQGMVFHSLYAPASGVYVEQLTGALEGELNIPAFERAWQNAIARHSILRTAFATKNLDKMFQVVHRRVHFAFDQRDWRACSSTEQSTRLDEFLRADRARGFDLARAPLMRLALMRTADDVWRFVWTTHHALLDGWSLPLLLREVLTSYEAFRRDQIPALEPARPYREYIAWLQNQDAARAETFWRAALAGFIAPTPLVVDHAPTRDAAEYAELETRLSPALTTTVQTFARDHRLTLNTLTQGAWALLLSRYSGERDVVFGATVAGRPADLPGAETMLGLFINTLPVRAQIAPAAMVLPWLAELQARQSATRQFEHTPLVEIANWSAVPRGAPLFESILVFENYPVGDVLCAASLRVRDLRAIEQTNYPLTAVAGTDRELVLKISYDTRRFDRAAIERMIGHWRTLLEQLPARADQSLATCSMITDTERAQLLALSRGARVEIPARSITDLIAAQVARAADAIAVTCGDQALTYRELDARANQLAHYLRRLGVRADTLVALCVERSLEMIVGILGILKAGGAYVPLDPAYPRERLAFMLDDSSAPILVTQSNLVSHITHPERSGAESKDDSRITIQLDTDWARIAQENATPLDAIAPHQLAYVIYTSGSTGQPKGVMIPHRALVNHATALAQLCELAPADRVLQFISLSFDAAAEEIFPTLITGATLVLWHANQELNSLATFCADERISVLHMPATVWHQWLAEVREWKSPVRVLLVGGDTPAPAKLREWVRLNGACKFINAYGPTEATITTSVFAMDCDAASVAALEKIPMGRPIANAQIYLLDEHLQPVPLGVPGELHIGGIGLARGYLHRPELTSEKFIICHFPFTDSPLCLYKTGDRARWRDDGNLEFLGRRDDQVKVRGFRIELGEVEAALAQNAQVREAVVIAREDTPGDKRLVAYVAQQKDLPGLQDLEGLGLREFLRAKLPDWMIPNAFVLLDALPRLPGGKVNRRALRAPTETESPAGFVAPRTPTEEILAGILAHVLGVARVGVHDNFFDLGGHSLLATRVIARVRDAFQIELPLRALFEHPTIAEIAPQIETTSTRDAPPILSTPRDDELPVAFAQERLWFLDQLAPGNLFHNLPIAVRLTGALDVPALERALNALIVRHESLRTTIATRDGTPRQIIAPELRVHIPVVAVESENDALQIATAEARQPFDLARGPLVRARLIRLAPDDHIALLILHHIIADGWSLSLLTHELATLYQGAPLPALPVQYADFARWQREWLQGETLDAQIAYWQTRLAYAPPMLDLPTDRPRPAQQTFNGAHHLFILPPSLTDALVATSRRENVTPFMILLAAYETLLQRYTGQSDFCIGTPIANRRRAEIENLIGFFVNTLVLRADLAGEPSGRALIKRVREIALGAYAHQDVPFEMLVARLHPERNLSHTPFFQTMFVFDNTPRGAITLPNLTITPFEIESGKATFDLTFAVTQNANGWGGYCEYNTDLFDAETIARMARHFEILLQQIIANPDAPITTYQFLTDGERDQLAVWNSTAADFPRDVCIHQLFEHQVDAHPDARALIFENQSLTYRELDARANQLARFLRARGVAPDTIVALCTERSIEMIVGILGILKAGGAYLPLDPNYPADRLAFMLEDSHAPILLTQSNLVSRPLRADHASRLTLCLDTDWTTLAQESDARLENQVAPENLAYVIYTSGSTGTPKGTLLAHRGLCNLATWQQRAFDIREGKRVLQFSPFSFDASVWETFMALRNGGALVLARQETLASALDLVALLRAQRVTTVTLPPSMLAVMPRDELPELETIIAAGEACPRALVERWGVGRKFFDAYGPTETTVCASIALCDPRDERAPSIGTPIANTQLYILDAHLQATPIGVPGELHIGGVGLARGYLNRPELTAEKFITVVSQQSTVNCPLFTDNCSLRLYKTGDLARYRADGAVEFLGRLDHQVKVRGFRIELGEIEAVLCAHAAVREAVVMAREDAPGDKRIVAYIVPREDLPGFREANLEGLRAHLRARLPEYMVPSAFVMLEALPLTPSGKVDRRALPVPDRASTTREYVAPRDATEEKLAALCAELLRVERVGVEDDFFELGGHSLLATQFISRIRDEFAIELALRTLFEKSTLAALACEIERVRAEGVAINLPPIKFVARDAHRVKLSTLVKPGDGSATPEITTPVA